MRRSPQAEIRYWSNELPLDLVAAAGYGIATALLAAPLAYLAAMYYFRHSRSLDASQQVGASAFLALFAAAVSGSVSAIAIFLFRHFRRLYRNPL